LAGEPATLGVPALESARSAAAQAVDEAWARLVDRDLPAAAERSWLRFFRLLLDLPVYALLAWIVYQVALGFWNGAYIGVDFLLSATLLLVAYLFTIRFAVRFGLALRARRLLADVILRTRRALGAQADTTRESVRHAAAQQRSALQRLAELEDEWRAELQGR
jgi:hypothetical protein